MSRALVVMAITTLALLACTPVVPPATAPRSSDSREPVDAALLPILTEAQAIETALKRAAQAMPEVNAGRDIGSPRARLMTLQEYEDRFTSSRTYYDRTIPVWVVSMEGRWGPAGIAASPSATPTPFTHGVEVLDARTGETVSAMRSNQPIRLEDARGLNPAAFGRYPVQVSLARARQLAEFPVFEPARLPQGYSLARVTLALSHPLLESLALPMYPCQMVVLDYANGAGDTIQVAHARGWLPDNVPGAARTRVGGVEGWESGGQGGPVWLAWQATYPNERREPGPTYLTHFLYSQSDSVTLGLLREIAASLPVGGTLQATPTPVPIAVAPPVGMPHGQQASGWAVNFTPLTGRLEHRDGLVLITRDNKEYRLTARCTRVEAALRDNAGRDVGLMVESDSVAPGATLVVLGVNPGGGIIPTCTDSSGRPLAPPAPPPAPGR